MILFCGSDPIALGISSGGVWDMVIFRAHVDGCEVCRCGARHVMRLMGASTSEAKKAAARANGSAPVKPGSKPRGRPSKITPPGQDR